MKSKNHRHFELHSFSLFCAAILSTTRLNFGKHSKRPAAVPPFPSSLSVYCNSSRSSRPPDIIVRPMRVTPVVHKGSFPGLAGGLFLLFNLRSCSTNQPSPGTKKKFNKKGLLNVHRTSPLFVNPTSNGHFHYGQLGMKEHERIE